jgi:hypothetical protein
MNYLIRDMITNKVLAFYTNAPKDIVIWLAKKNQDRPDTIAKRDHNQINHVLDFVPYHIRSAGYDVQPVKSKLVQLRIDVKSFMSIDLDLMKYQTARDLTGLYRIDGCGIRVGKGTTIYNGFDWSPGMKTVKLVRTWMKGSMLKVTVRYVKLKQDITLVKI